MNIQTICNSEIEIGKDGISGYYLTIVENENLLFQIMGISTDTLTKLEKTIHKILNKKKVKDVKKWNIFWKSVSPVD